MAQTFCNHKAADVLVLQIAEQWYPQEPCVVAAEGIDMTLQKHDLFIVQLWKEYNAHKKHKAFRYKCSLPQLVVKNASGEEIPASMPYELTLSNVRWVLNSLLKQYHELVNRRYALSLEPPGQFDAALLSQPLLDGV